MAAAAPEDQSAAAALWSALGAAYHLSLAGKQGDAAQGLKIAFAKTENMRNVAVSELRRCEAVIAKGRRCDMTLLRRDVLKQALES